MRLIKRSSLLLALASMPVLAVTLAGAGGSTAAGGCTATIGLEAPLTGPVGILGTEQLRFAQLALSLDNQASGTAISLVQGDTRLSPARARTVTQQFISNSQIVAVAGPAGSQEVEAVGPLFGSAGMAFISGSATKTTLTRGANPTFFRVVASDSKQGPEDAGFIIHQLRPKAVMVVDDRSHYSTTLAGVMVSLLRRAGIRVDHESISQQQTQFARLVHKVSPRVGVVILPWEIAANAQLFGQQLARAHCKAVIVGTDGLFSPFAFTIKGSYVSTFAPDITAIPSDQGIVHAAHFKVGTFGPPTYAATDVIASAIAAVCRSGQQPTRANVLSQIRLTNEPSSILAQPIRFAATGELEGARWFIFKIDHAHNYRMLSTATG